ncbi:hypothetical protein O181_032485 [Austropuccinia psidii MF-1]|uniref:Uncharacterized protein n=1 Tax=Austropuccinia psidii MF-1 TaxID=1389203 RepID=A0A9Q3D148_9BASI|nr:hypothetical protein [Austropuccinia psidii MF-1]
MDSAQHPYVNLNPSNPIDLPDHHHQLHDHDIVTHQTSDINHDSANNHSHLASSSKAFNAVFVNPQSRSTRPKRQSTNRSIVVQTPNFNNHNNQAQSTSYFNQIHSSTPSSPKKFHQHQNSSNQNLPLSRSSSNSISSQPSLIINHHQIDLLHAIDPAVQAASTLSHIKNSLFMPTIVNRFSKAPFIGSDEFDNVESSSKISSPQKSPNKPISPNPIVITSSPSSSTSHHSNQNITPSTHQNSNSIHQLDQEEEKFDQHVLNIIKYTQPEAKLSLSINHFKRIMKGIWAFVKTPMGIIFTIYGFLVVFWGAALVLILFKWIKITPEKNYRIWVEICSQILNGLFTITGIGLFPSRIIDWWNISIILRYARVIWRRKSPHSMKDPNDLNPQMSPTAQEAGSRNLTEGEEGEEEEEEVVLNHKELKKLRRAQERLCRSQTWYRPHSSATHFAFPIRWALVIMILNLGNSLFQAGLCVAMWGYSYSNRPAWTTGTFMALSFSCGLFSALLIWRIGEGTLKSKQVLIRIQEALRPTKRQILIDKVVNPRRSRFMASSLIVDRGTDCDQLSRSPKSGRLTSTNADVADSFYSLGDQNEQSAQSTNNHEDNDVNEKTEPDMKNKPAINQEQNDDADDRKVSQESHEELARERMSVTSVSIYESVGPGEDMISSRLTLVPMKDKVL